jgi:hypothetical protein
MPADDFDQRPLCPFCSGTGHPPDKEFECFECRFSWSRYRRMNRAELKAYLDKLEADLRADLERLKDKK